MPPALFGVQDTELLDFLFTCGEMCYGLEKLWDYDVRQGISNELCDLFNKAYDTWGEAVRGDGAVNAAYAFVNSTSLEEYCSRCRNMCAKLAVYADNEVCVPTEDFDDLPFPTG